MNVLLFGVIQINYARLLGSYQGQRGFNKDNYLVVCVLPCRIVVIGPVLLCLFYLQIVCIVGSLEKKCVVEMNAALLNRRTFIEFELAGHGYFTLTRYIF